MPYWAVPRLMSVTTESDGSVTVYCEKCEKTVKTFTKPADEAAVLKAAKKHKH